MKKIISLFLLLLLQIFHAQPSMRETDSAKLPSVIIDINFNTKKLQPWQKLHKSITNKHTLAGEVVGKLAFQILSALLVFKGCAIAHECGHALALKVLFNVPSTLYIPASLTTILHGCLYNKPIPLGIKSALMYAAGPLTGIAAHCIILKMNSIIHELITNTKLPLKERILHGLRMPLINNKQQFGIKMATMFGLFVHFLQFIPSKHTLPIDLTNEFNKGVAINDGYGILESLGYYK